MCCGRSGTIGRPLAGIMIIEKGCFEMGGGGRLDAWPEVGHGWAFMESPLGGVWGNEQGKSGIRDFALVLVQSRSKGISTAIH